MDDIERRVDGGALGQVEPVWCLADEEGTKREIFGGVPTGVKLEGFVPI